MKKCKAVVVLGACFAAGMAWADAQPSIRVGFAENGGVDVPDGQTVTQGDTVVVENEGTFIKTGEGTYALDQAKLDQTHKTALTVLEGKVALTAGQFAPAATAPACLAAKAALWLTVESAVTNGSDVTEWRDVRDVRDATALYPRFKPAWFTAAEGYDFTNQKPVLETTNGITAVNFGGWRSNKYMRLYDKNGTAAATVSGVWHAFVVHGAFTCFGYVLGNASSRYSYVTGKGMSETLPQMGSGAPLFHNRGDLHKRHQNARVRLNGDIVSPFTTTPLTGFQLLSFEHTDYCGAYNTLMYNNFEMHKGGQGGDDIAEVILFTQHLTEAERIDVERYLMAKYGFKALDAKTPMGHQDYGATANVTLAKDATLEVDAAAGVTSAPIGLNGNGTVVKKGEGCLAIGPSDDDKATFGGTFDLQGGSVFLRGGQMPPMVARGGKKLTAAAENNGGDTLALQAKSGIRGTMTDQAKTATFVKDGVGEARVNQVEASVKRLEVAAGTLVLEAPALSCGAVTNGGAIYATIPNADFEMPVTNMVGNGRFKVYSHPANGWVAGNTDGVAYLTTTNSWSTWNSDNIKPRFGTQVLLIVQGNSVWTTMSVPKAGFYELTLWCHNRAGKWSAGSEESVYNGPYSRSLLKVQLGKTTSTVSTIGYAQGSSACEFVPTRIVTPYLEAGNYCLMLAGTDFGLDCAVTVDDLACRYIAEERPKVAYEIPNGDFEQWTRTSTPPSFPYVTWRQLVSGWTWDFWDPTEDGSKIILATNSLVGVVCAGTPLLRNNDSCDFLLPFAERFTGAGMLFLGTKSNGYARTTFTPPKGTFRLRAKVWQRRTAIMVGASSGSEFNRYGNEESYVYATLTRADSSVIGLGRVETTEGQVGREVFWPKDLTFDGTEEVTLTLWQGPYNCIGALVDELALVDVTKPYDFGELIFDGSFEDPDTLSNDSSRWGTWADASFYKYGYVGVFKGTSGDNWAFGYALYDGARTLRFQQIRGAWQDVTIPQPGTYRLTFREMTRPNNLAGNGKNRIQAFFVDRNVTPFVTNRVCMITPQCANFVEHSYLVKFDAAKVYRFHIGGAGLDPTKVNEDRVSKVDGVSLRRVTEELAAAPDAPASMRVSVADGADLYLNYTGTMTCSGVTYGGHIYHGLLSAATNPEFISGPGTIDAGSTPGCILILR